MIVAVLFGSTALVPAAMAQQADRQAQAQDRCQELVSYVEENRHSEQQMDLTLDEAERIADRGSEAACATALSTVRANLGDGLQPSQAGEATGQQAGQAGQQQDEQRLTQQGEPRLEGEERQAELGDERQPAQQESRQPDQQAQQPRTQQEQQQVGQQDRSDRPALEQQAQQPGQDMQRSGGPGSQEAFQQAQQRLERAQQQLRQAMDQQAAAQQELEQALYDLRMATGQGDGELGAQDRQQPGEEQQAQQPGGQDRQQSQQDRQLGAQDQQAQTLGQDQQAGTLGQQDRTERQTLRMGEQQPADQQAQLQGAQSVPVEELRGAEVIGAEGESIGEVQRVMESGGERYVIVAAGGFLGLGERDVALPLSSMEYRDGQLVLSGLTEEQLQNMQEADIADFQPVEEGETQIGSQPAQ